MYVSVGACFGVRSNEQKRFTSDKWDLILSCLIILIMCGNFIMFGYSLSCLILVCVYVLRASGVSFLKLIY